MRHRYLLTAIISSAMLVLLAAPALGHVTADPSAVAGPYLETAFRIGHGCAGAPTTAIRVQMPEEVVDARPQEADGWDLDVVDEDGRTEIAWTGGELADGDPGDFVVSMQIDDAAGVVYFPLLQSCDDDEYAWVEIPDSLEQWGDLEEPAPYVAFGAHGGADGGHSHDDEDAGHSHGDDSEEGNDSAAEDADAEVVEADEDHPGQTADDEAEAAPERDEAPTPISAEAPGESAEATTDPLVYVALGVSVLALAVGLGAYAQVRRS